MNSSVAAAVVAVVVRFVIDSSSSVIDETLVDGDEREVVPAAAQPFQNRLPAESGREKADRAAANIH